MTFALEIGQTGSENVIAMLGSVRRLSADPITPARAELAAWFRAFERRQFASEGAAGASGRWRPLSERYRRWKERRYPGTEILERTGRLMRSLVGRTGDTIETSSVRLLRLGTSVPYARFHQLGEGSPRRAPIDVTNRDAAEVASIVRRRFFAEVRAARRGTRAA